MSALLIGLGIAVAILGELLKCLFNVPRRWALALALFSIGIGAAKIPVESSAARDHDQRIGQPIKNAEDEAIKRALAIRMGGDP